jgi:hypothetical protein
LDGRRAGAGDPSGDEPIDDQPGVTELVGTRSRRNVC